MPEAGPPLVARAEETDQPEIARAAVEALAVLAANLAAADETFSDPEAVTAAILAASESPEQGLRSSAAFSLGVVSGDGAAERLEVLCNDVNDDVRYNAALGLARLGRGVAWETLTEMLTLPDVAAPPGDDEAQAARYKRAMVVVNALKGVSLLVDDTSQPPPEAVTTAVAALHDDDIADVRQGARALLKRIGRLDEATEAAVPAPL